MHEFHKITSMLPKDYREPVKQLPENLLLHVEEIRLICGQRICLRGNGIERFLDPIVTMEDLNRILHNLIQYSYYAYEKDLASGFVTIEGGHRVGICGHVVIKQGEPALIQEISSLNIRFAKEVKGCSDGIFHTCVKDGKLMNVLIVSPPGCGKTTLLRDFARNYANHGYRVGLCDERSELAGMYHGKPSFDIGSRTDVLDGCEKAFGIPMLIRSMAPQVIITDEIGKPEDISAIHQCLISGVALVTSIHGSDERDVLHSAIGSLAKNGTFQRYIYLTSNGGVGTIREVASSV